jgi:type IV pilus assembly protein PilB
MALQSKSFWEFMKTDVGEIVTELGPRKAGGLDSRADEIIARASADAQRRGVPVETVLAEMGFNLGGGDQPRAAGARDNMLKDLAWGQVQAGGTDSAQVAVARRQLQDALLPVEQADVAPILAGTDFFAPSFLGKLRCCGAVDDKKVREAKAAGNGNGLDALLAVGVAPEKIAAVLMTEPYFPPSYGDHTDFKDFIVTGGRIGLKDLREIEAAANGGKYSYVQALIELGKMNDAQLAQATCEFLKAELLTEAPKRIPASMTRVFPVEWVRHFGIVPIRKNGERLIVATSHPLQGWLLRRLESVAACPVGFQQASADVLDALVQQHVKRWQETEPAPAQAHEMVSAVERTSTTQQEALKAAITHRSAVEIVRKLVEGALESRATDIHLEPLQDDARVRYRIDGILHDVLQVARDLFDEVLARIKILADLDIAERRRPQDGHILLEINDKPYDLRVASLPTKLGEKVAIRIADAGREITGLDRLGLSSDALATIRGLVGKPFGMILTTGPVGSGKTTSLYSCLGEINREQRQVVSIEDPVEIQLHGANQVEVNYDLGVDFVRGLRALLRQDPDVILLGEIRDDETAKIAVRASMTGLLVFSSLHTNDTTGTITALRNFDIPPHLIASSLLGVGAQRLVRKICEACRVPGRRRKDDAARLGLEELPKGFKSFEGKGCDKCYGTGCSGRTAVFELFVIDPAIREMILNQASERAIRAYAIERGMKTLQDDGLDKIMNGVTTIEEFERVLRF